MAEKALYSLKSNAGRLSQRLSENVAEHTRDSGLIDSFASGSGGGSGKYLENGAVVTPAGIEETKRMLGSKRELEKSEGLKRVIAMMIRNLPVASFFPLVTALLSPSTPLESRTLISLYITHCASTAPSLALLSINAYQKDLSDPNPIVRAGAIKTLSEMGLSDIRSLVGVAVLKGARDTSWYVKRACGNALRSLYKSDSTNDNKLSLIPTLIILLNSATPLTIGSALSAWEEICPRRWDLIHGQFRKWCKMLLDIEEWGQTILLRVIVRYGRTFFLDPNENEGGVDADLELVLKSTNILLNHINPAVVTAAVKVYYYLAPNSRLNKIVKPLLRILHSDSKEIQAVVLADCAIIAKEKPYLFSDFATEFFTRFDDSVAVKSLRLEILTSVANESNVRLLLREFLTCIKDPDDSISACAIAAIGTCAERVPGVAEECLKTLIRLSQSKNDTIISQSVLVLRSLIISSNFPNTVSRAALITRLVVLLDANKIKTDQARANVYWLVGQFGESLLETVGPDVVRVGAKGFTQESNLAKLQLLTLSAKLLVLSHLSKNSTNLRTLSLLFTYLTTLARYDLNYQVRDRARFLKGLLSSAEIGLLGEGGGARVELEEDDFKKGLEVEEQGEATLLEGIQRGLSGESLRKILFEGKDMSRDSSDSITTGESGVISLVLSGKRLAFTLPLPAYSTTVPPSSIRDPIIDSLSINSSSKNFSSSNYDSRSGSPNVMRGFGSDSMNGGGGGNMNGGRSTPVVLVPTFFSSNQDQEEEEEYERGGNARKVGFIDLEDFYKEGIVQKEESDSEEDDSEEDDSEEEDDSSGSEGTDPDEQPQQH